jgi:hypothetical protein
MTAYKRSDISVAGESEVLQSLRRIVEEKKSRDGEQKETVRRNKVRGTEKGKETGT